VYTILCAFLEGVFLRDGDVSAVRVFYVRGVGDKISLSYVIRGCFSIIPCFFTGLPQRYQDSVKAIQTGLPLFLYNYSTRSMHGVFEVSSGRAVRCTQQTPSTYACCSLGTGP